MNFILNLVLQAVSKVWLTLLHNWSYLLVSVVIAVLLKRYVDAEKISAFLKHYRGAGVAAATIAAVATPLCSCGTTAVVLGMMASMMPWAPIVAFMVASPLTSPEGLIYNAGLFGWPFSLAFFASSILLGLGGGWIATVFESKGWLVNQTRFVDPVSAPCACSAMNEKQPVTRSVPGLGISNLALAATGCDCDQPAVSCGCAEPAPSCACSQADRGLANDQATSAKSKAALFTVAGISEFFKEMYGSGKQLLVMFLGFAFIGYFLNGLIPASWVAAMFGSGNAYSVPLAATLGLPLYLNSEASLPLVRALLDVGMSQGAALAFMISGAGTSIGAIAGALTIARWRVIALVVGILWIGAVVLGYLYNFLLAAGIL
jgi:hypothetical protein